MQVVLAEQFRGAESCLEHAKHCVIRLNPTAVYLGSSEGLFVLEVRRMS